MFTPEAFKDLLAPLLEDLLHQSLRLPLKNSTIFDFSIVLNAHISECGLDPRTFAQQLKTLTSTRSVCLPETASTNAMEMFQYFLELEHVSHRFGLSSFLKSSFTWSDSLKPDISGSQSSLAFEKANILFNIGAKLHNDALSKTRDENLKLQVKTLCTGATVFDWISSNFDHAPLFDINKPLSKFFSKLCLLAAQELAFFSAVSEQKGLKVLARISLGLMSCIKGCQNALLMDTDGHDLSYFQNCLEVKTLFHNAIHCLIMAEFWDTQQLPDIAHDLFRTAKTNLEASLIRNKTPFLDYLEMSILRSGKEKEQLFGASAKASESTVTVEPFFIATLIDFREVIAPYAATYESIFKSIYPLKVIEAQSAFENKAHSLVSTLLATLDGPENSLQLHVVNSSRTINDIVINIRNNLTGTDNLKKVRAQVQEKLADLDAFLKVVSVKHPDQSADYDLENITQEAKNITERLEKAKLSLICSDASFVEALRMALSSIYSTYLKDLQESSATLEASIKDAQESIQEFKNEVKLLDIKEELLGSADFNQVIEQNLKKIEARAAQIVGDIENQKMVLEKSQRISAAFEDASKTTVLQHFPQLPTIVQLLANEQNAVLELCSRLEMIANTFNQQLIAKSAQNRLLLLELLNKN